MIRVSRAIAVGLCSVGVLAGSLIFSSAPALGFVIHPYLSQITEANGAPLGTNNASYSLSAPLELTFDASGNLLVPDAFTNAVDLFNSSDVFTGQLGVGDFVGYAPRSVSVNKATGYVYVGANGTVNVYKPEGAGKYKLVQKSPAGAVGEQAFVYAAVDNANGPHKGDVYVQTDARNTIQVVKPNAEGELNVGAGESLPQSEEGFYYASLEGGPASDQSMAFGGASGTVYLANPGRGFVDVYNSEDVYQSHLSGPGGPFTPTALAVEQSTGDLYAVDSANSVVDEFNASGKLIGRITETPTGALSAPTGVAVNSSGQVAVSDGGSGVVDVFGPAVVVPEAATGNASAVLRTSAKLEGAVNPEGEEVTSCEFEYGTSTAYGHTAACTPAPGSGSSPVSVSAEVSGLTPGTTYDYRLMAGNAKGANRGLSATLTTVAVVPKLQTEAASGIEQPVPETIVATLHGSLEPHEADTNYYFEYGETEAYGSVSPALPGADAGEASKVETVQTQISGLRAATTYHFRLVGVNSFGVQRGADLGFSTPAREFSPPAVGVLPATDVSQFAATLNGTLVTHEALVDYRFEYGTTTAYGSLAPVPDGDTSLTSETVTIAQPVSGLQAGTTYHYRIVASSPGATEVKGPDETFTTLPVPAPTASTGASSGVGVGSATLSGTIDPHGWDTTYLFEYGTSTAYGSSWPTVQVDMGALEGPQPVVVGIPNLLPSTTYHYRLVATNGGGTSYGQDMTFTTGEYPAQVIQEPVAFGTLLVPSEPGKVTTSEKKKAGKGKRKPKRKGKARHAAKHRGRRRRGHAKGR
ncbi:MAG TPA: hypothetical protein VNV42_00895 [Solirubrobacteraceae bacterium]|jgi:hypothetical protein|nr:hypothetical protein [Solirubrobacteraceae bacterium]